MSVFSNVREKAAHLKDEAARYVPSITPEGGMSRADYFWLRWGVLSVSVLAVDVALLLTGVYQMIGRQQLNLLGGHPFYMEAEALTNSLLDPVTTFSLCVLLVLVLSWLLLRLRGAAARSEICFLAALALALPGCICSLYSGVLYMAPFVCSVLLLWFLSTTIPFFRNSRI